VEVIVQSKVARFFMAHGVLYKQMCVYAVVAYAVSFSVLTLLVGQEKHTTSKKPDPVISNMLELTTKE